jgi:hypothetical protein
MVGVAMIEITKALKLEIEILTCSTEPAILGT